jgi:hypothetical protein
MFLIKLLTLGKTDAVIGAAGSLQPNMHTSKEKKGGKKKRQPKMN